MSFAGSPKTSPPLRILLVEDSDPFAELVKAQLLIEIDLPHEFMRAVRLQIAIELLHKSEFDLVILDMHLPDSNGLDTFFAVQSRASDIPIVILSSDDSEELAIECMRAGAQDYLLKGHNDGFKIARAIRFAIERKKRLHADSELAAARQIQQTLLPEGDPRICGFDISGKLTPAVETAGDYYDFLNPMSAIGNGAVGIAVGDVSGHGMGPAMVMSEARAAIHSFALMEKDIGRILELTNTILCRSRHHHFLTLMLACVDPVNLEVTYSSAGQPGWHMSSDGAVTRLEATGPPLGMLAGELVADGWPVSSLPLSPGDLLLITTDGSHESRSESGELLGENRILERVLTCRNRPAREIVERLSELIAEHAGNSIALDDITIVVVKCKDR